MSDQESNRLPAGIHNLKSEETGCRHEASHTFRVQGHIDQVFGLFDQLDPERDGTGVGLALVRRIIEAHGGRIWVESDGRGGGSSFCFTLPPIAGMVPRPESGAS